jgi:hypothetical protein
VKQSPLAGIDLAVYPRALVLLLRNPSIVLVPLLTTLLGVLMARVISPDQYGLAGVTNGLGGLIVQLIELFGVGVACIMADDAWRHGSASFDNGWTEGQRKGGELLVAAIGVTLILAVAQYAGLLLGTILSLLLMAVAAYFLIWTIPAAAVGGIPGGAAIQVSIDRVRANPLPAALVAVVTVFVAFFAPAAITSWLEVSLFPFLPTLPLVASLIGALVQAIALSYVALVITKTYTDATFTRRY